MLLIRGWVVVVLAAAALVAPTRASADNFNPGALIIPSGASFQTDCGAVSEYGLVYDILRANQWLAANPPHHAITINYAYSTGKGSPNRCPPTDQSTPPAPTTDTHWSDGCDFSIPNASGTPVKLVNNNSTGVGGDSVFSTIDTTSNGNVYPQFHNQAVDGTVHSVNYLGGPFIISDTDAPDFLALLQGTLIAQDAFGNNIDFSPFRTTGTCGSLTSNHYVNIHRAQTGFSTTIATYFTASPARLALLANDVTNVSGSTPPLGVTNGIIDVYLANAGLTFPTAAGCPTGGHNIGDHTICPGGANPGQIYDNFDLLDFAANLQTNLDIHGHPAYQMIWSPHWHPNAGGSSSPNATELAAMNNISAFIDTQGGLMAECASIEAFEGGYDSGSKDEQIPFGHFQTCVNDGTGNCAATGTNWGMDIGRGSFFGLFPLSPAGKMRNCSDPSATTGMSCAYYGYSGDPFVQTADYEWSIDYGNVQEYAPSTHSNSMYKPGVVTLLSLVSTLDKTKLSSPATARAMITYDLATRNVKDNAPGKGNILYHGGHDETGEVSATKLVLQTLLQLGAPTVPPITTTTEVSRSTPIAAAVGGIQAIVTGSFLSVNPAPALVCGTPKVCVQSPADIASWTFPFITGHLRAITASTITTTAAALGAGTVLFDAALLIPPPTVTGCATPFDGACRTIFTTTTDSGTGSTFNPPIVFVHEGNAGTVGPIINPAGGPPAVFGTTQWKTMMDRILQAPLGGVDRSTVAVIPQSGVAGGVRPTIAYFGATDGMLHAVCATVDLAHGCTTIGTELWAFLPRTQLPLIHLNQQRIDGSPRVSDLFGDFSGSGTRTFRTILTFQTTSGSTTTVDATPAIYALDVTNPQAPTVVFEYTMANAASPGTFEVGSGLALAVGPISVAGSTKNVVIAETNNGGSGGAGVVTLAINAETGGKLWEFDYAYPAVRHAGDQAVPATGIPGGAVALDQASQGFLTDVTFGDLYGNLWLLDINTGISKVGANLPVFSYSQDFHAIGAPPAVYSDGTRQYAVVVPGGYADYSDSTWGNVAQTVVSVMLSARAATLDEGSGAPNVPFTFPLGAGEKGFAQATIIGGQLFVTSDNTDVNATGYGISGNSGRVYTSPLTSATTVVTVAGGASSLASSGTSIYTSSANSQQQLGSAAGITGPSVNTIAVPKLSRMLWLRTE